MDHDKARISLPRRQRALRGIGTAYEEGDHDEGHQQAWHYGFDGYVNFL